MALLEDIKRTAADVADKVAKKTNDLTSIAKVTMSIKSSESKLSSIYEEIGFLFYTAERNGVDFTEEIASEIIKADELNAEIDVLKKKSAMLRNVVVCPECGNEISNDACYCSFCGAEQADTEEECDAPSEETEETENTDAE